MPFDQPAQRWMHQALDALSELFFVFSQEGRLLFWNERLVTATGYADDDIAAMHVLDFFDETDGSRVERAIKMALRKGQATIVAHVVAKDGRRTPFEFTGSVLTEDGDVVGICGIGRDISERLAAQQSLAETKKWLQSIFQNAGIGIAALDAASMQFLLTNPALHRRLGYSAEQMQRLTLDNITHPDDREATQKTYQAALNDPSQVERIETRYLTRNEEVIWGRATISAVEDTEGRPFFIGTFEDISAARKYRTQRDNSRSRWQSLVENHPESVLIIEQHRDRIAFANEAAARVLGTDALEEILDRSILDFIPPSEHAALREHLFGEDAPVTAPYEHAIVSLDGRERTVRTVSSSVVYRDMPAAQVVIRDVTNQKQYENRLRSAKENAEALSNVQSAFLASMSHEIRTPLTAILGFTDLLTNELTGSSREMVGHIATSGERLLGTLNAILDLATLESGATQLTYEPVDVVALINKVLASFQSALDRKGLDAGLTVHCDEPVKIETDEEALTSILHHLISNAVKFTREGHVNITLKRDEEAALVVRIEDTGVGISKDFLPHIFDRFKQESAGLHREYEGTGIGLAVTKRLVHQVDGSIDVKSQKSVGSVFTLRLPHAPAAPDARKAPDPAAPSATAEDSRLLILEDNAITLRLLDRILKDDYRIDTATEADEALQLTRSTTYDGFLFDINLSERHTGIEVLHEIRSRPKHESTPAIACTAYGLREYKQAFLEAGFDAVIPKPVTKRSLLDSLKAVLTTPHAPHQAKAHDNAAMDIDLPPLPTTVPEVASLIAREDDTFDLDELTTILERDQIASMWLLRHINSAYYDLNAEVKSIDRAVVYAGFRPVCNLVLTEVLSKTFSDIDTPQAEAVYRHTMSTSLAAAAFSKTLATTLALDRSEVMYSAGLLCQIGRLLLLDQHGDAYVDLWYDDEDAEAFVGPPPMGREILSFGANYVQAGIRALQQSNVSHEILSLIRYHRHPEHVSTHELKAPVLAITVGLELAEALFNPHEEEDQSLGIVLQQSAPLEALAAHTNHPHDALIYALQKDVDRVASFVEDVLSVEENTLSTV